MDASKPRLMDASKPRLSLPCPCDRVITLDDGATVCTCCERVTEPVERWVPSHIAADGVIEMVLA